MNCAPFVSKTYEIVSDETTQRIVYWSSSGESFVIFDPEEFQTRILPMYFKHGNIGSFIRQLNSYGFRKVCPTQLEFAHPCFNALNPAQLIHIKRKGKSKVQKSQNAINELSSSLAKLEESEQLLERVRQDLKETRSGISAICYRIANASQYACGAEANNNNHMNNMYNRYPVQRQIINEPPKRTITFSSYVPPQNKPRVSPDETTNCLDRL